MAERLVSLISGGGTTMEQIGLAAKNEQIPGLEFAGVIASDTINAAKGIGRALQLGVPVAIANPERYRNPSTNEIDQYGFGQELLYKLRWMGATIVTQNGWLPWTPDNVIEAYADTMFNQHPGPVPETKNQHGIMPHATMIKLTELTGRNEGSEVIAQRVHPVMDLGKLVGIRKVEILDGDTPEMLQQRALPIEHQLQIDMLNQLMRGELKDFDQAYNYMRVGEEKTLRAARKWGREYAQAA